MLSCFARIKGNDHFRPVINDMGFKIWFCKGIVKLQVLYKDNNLMLFDKLKANYDVPQKHIFKYLQLRSFIRARFLKSHRRCTGGQMVRAQVVKWLVRMP